MTIRLTDPPQPPLPHPQPQQPDAAPVRPAMVYVSERQKWEYTVIVQPAISEHELNALGESGWELVGVVALPATAQFYFKPVRT